MSGHQIQIVVAEDFSHLSYWSLYPIFHREFHLGFIFCVDHNNQCKMLCSYRTFDQRRRSQALFSHLHAVASSFLFPQPCMTMLNVDPPLVSSLEMVFFTSGFFSN